MTKIGRKNRLIIISSSLLIAPLIVDSPKYVLKYEQPVGRPRGKGKTTKPWDRKGF